MNVPRCTRLRKVKSAFSLVEVLVCIAIIVVLVAIILPTLNSARKRSLLSQDVSNMRQFGIAAELYADTNNGVFPGFLAPLHASQFVPKELMKSPLDSTSEGWLNQYFEDQVRFNPNVKNRKYPFKQSYFGFHDLLRNTNVEEFRSLPGNPGRLISISPKPSYNLKPPLRLLGGPIFRLHFDGSVKRYVPRNLPNQIATAAAFRNMTDEELRISDD